MPSFLSLLALAALSAVALADNPIINSLSFSGNGCPQGTVKFSEVKYNGSTTWIYFDVQNFTTAIGSGSSVYDHTKNCQLHASFDLGDDWSVAAVGYQAAGKAYLESGVTATWFATYYDSEDASNTVTTQSSMTGGGSYASDSGQTFVKEDDVPNPVWSGCGGSSVVNANLRIALTSTDASADGTVALSKGTGSSWSFGVGLQFKNC